MLVGCVNVQTTYVFSEILTNSGISGIISRNSSNSGFLKTSTSKIKKKILEIFG